VFLIAAYIQISLNNRCR